MYNKNRKNKLSPESTTLVAFLVGTILIGILIGIINGCVGGSKNSEKASPVQEKPIKVDKPKEPPSPPPSPPCNESCIKEKIEAGEEKMDSLQSKLDNELKPLYNNHLVEYEKYHQYLRSKLPSLEIENHENFVRKCEQHIEICNILARTAFLQHSMNFVGEKIKKINTNYHKLDQIVWLLKKKLEIGEIIDSEEEEKELERLIKIGNEERKEDMPPAEAQDIGRLEKTIFDEIMGSK